MLEKYENMLKELGHRIIKCVAEHNFLLGAEAALKQLHAEEVAAKKEADKIVADVVDPTPGAVVEPVVEIPIINMP